MKNRDQLIDYLRKEKGENEWLEFKLNYVDPSKLGAYISALSNSAALYEKDNAYLIYGIDDVTHDVKGSSFKYYREKVGNENLENWLTVLLEPQVDFKVEEFLYGGKFPLTLFTIAAAKQRPVGFNGVEYIRVGSYTKPLKKHPIKMSKLWEKCNKIVFERLLAKEYLDDDQVLKEIAYSSYFDLFDLSLPTDKSGIISKLSEEKLILQNPEGFAITNLGAILFAKNLSHFDDLIRKQVRVIQYKGKNKIDTLKERTFDSGYALSFSEIIKYIEDLIPSNEVIKASLRQEVKMYPDVAIRELIANALIHQDLLERGTGPLIEIYSDRIEISNPGKPLVPVLRFIDHNPQSRNEKLAYFMRRLKICEERGSGIDKVVFQCEIYQLPAPDFIEGDNYLKAVLYQHKPLNLMSKDDKIRACYQHCCLKYVSNEQMTNQSFRERLKVKSENYPAISRIIAETVDKKLIKVADPENKSNKYRSYIPIWA